VRSEFCTLPGRAHGGVLMAFADTLGAYGTCINLPAGAGTTTIESKTNFFAAGREGSVLRGEATPLHIGRRTMVWQTRITSGDALVALVTQTQMVLPRSERRESRAAQPELLLRDVASAGALGAEVVGDLGRAIGPLSGLSPELDQPKPRTQPREARVVAQLGHSVLEQERRAIAVRTHQVVRVPAGPRCAASDA
jgi:uncharacterized protein (TIGR00369 family)